MANTFLTPDVIADAAIAVLYENAVMAQLVNRDYENEFGRKVGDTITIKTPTTFVANDFAGSITVQDATETSQSLTLDKHKDVSFAVGPTEMTLEIGDFTEQLLVPAMEALWQQIDVDLLALRSDVTAEVGSTSAHAWDDPRVLIDARRVLNEANVPLGMRRFVGGPISEAAFLGDALFHEADKRGDTAGLRDAALGRVFGFDTYMDQHVDDLAGTVGAEEEVALAFHRDAITLAFRPLALPMGAAEARYRNYKGFSLRVVMDYDLDAKTDTISIDCLYGMKVIDPDKAVLVKPADAA